MMSPQLQPRFQSTRPVWGATGKLLGERNHNRISIHAPRVGRDLRQQLSLLWQEIFQSTRPVWGATAWARRTCRWALYFNPRAPCGARRYLPRGCLFLRKFQSTRPVWGATFSRSRVHSSHRFQSTRPVWGATADERHLLRPENISIHAPRVGRDFKLGRIATGGDISIHAPRVGRDGKFDDFTPSNLHKRYKRVLARPKNTRKKGKIKQKRACIHAFSAFLGCEGSGTFCALVLRTQYR